MGKKKGSVPIKTTGDPIRVNNYFLNPVILVTGKGHCHSQAQESKGISSARALSWIYQSGIERANY